jgi:hypothetical protein
VQGGLASAGEGECFEIGESKKMFRERAGVAGQHKWWLGKGVRQYDSNYGREWWETVETQHTTTCCSMQVVDITLVKYHFTNITSLRVVQQKHSGLYSRT